MNNPEDVKPEVMSVLLLLSSPHKSGDVSMIPDSIKYEIIGGIKDVRLSFPQEIKLKNNNKTRTFNLLTLSFAFQGLPISEAARN